MFEKTYWNNERLRAIDWSKATYGYNGYRLGRLFKRPDGTIDFVHDNAKVAEIKPNGDRYLCLPEVVYGARVQAIWQAISGAEAITIRRVKDANGVEWTTLTFLRRVQDYKSGRWEWEKVSEAKSSSRFKVWVDSAGRPQLENASPNLVVNLDKDRFNAYKKKIRAMQATLVAQAKVGAYPELYKVKEREAIMKNTFTEWRHSSEVYEQVLSHVDSYINVPDPTKLRALMYNIIGSESHYYETFDGAGLAKLVQRACKKFEQRFRREQCVTIAEASESCTTISESKNSLSDSDDSDDQDSIVLPPNGLREVQVPREAEVC